MREEAEAGNIEDVTKQEELVATIDERTFLSVAALKILPYIATFSSEADQMLTDAEPAMSKQSAICRPAIFRKHGQPCPGIRVRLPPGVLADVAVFVIQAPVQENWPYGLKPPPLKLDAAQPFPSDLEAYWNNLTRVQGNTIARIEYDVDEASIRCECAAISDMNDLWPHTPQANWWSYLVAFEPRFMPPKYDLTEMFTGLGKAKKAERFLGQHAEAVEVFQRARMARIFITGGPGSGKSTFATTVVTAILDGEIVTVSTTDQIQADYETKTSRSREWIRRLRRNSLSRTSDDAVAEQETAEAQTSTDYYSVTPIVPTLPTEEDRASLTSGEVLNSLTDALRSGYPSNTLFPSGFSADEDVPSSSKLTPLVWTAPQNAQVGEAVCWLQAKARGKRIVRVYSYNRELRALMAAKLDGPEDMTIDEDSPESAEHLINHINDFKASLYMENNPASDPASLAMQLREIAKRDPAKYMTILEAWDLQVSDPASYKEHKRDYLYAARQAMADFICKADVIAGTPVALHMLYNRVPQLKPCFIVIDKAGRMTENMAILPIVQHPNVPALWIGDTSSDRPMAAAEQDEQYNALFTAQRKRSLLRRVEGAGQGRLCVF
ncbi:hypothetical protein M419DRAFT_35849 [Trichoderma reesei RUT C-30]|uniref:DNA2/NAM7 helicase helicase domain-containing protein n=1 Tax=Hypocrea jecorina (strain ATCC 56765 / BCRC 32924 / NRRL 11460 / Rut C-30) TaxID=1344414 RepID=A0A024SB90_HYPJR|nr:hypothetical protein M419DRAFT_35849 [Trichoderma reesei RUT C-30]